MNEKHTAAGAAEYGDGLRGARAEGRESGFDPEALSDMLKGEGFTDSQFLVMTAPYSGPGVMKDEFYAGASLCPRRTRTERKKYLRERYLAGSGDGNPLPFEEWWDGMESQFIPNPTELAVPRSELKERAGGAPAAGFTVEDLERLLYGWGVTVRRNVISHEIEIDLPEELERMNGGALSRSEVLTDLWNYVLVENVSCSRDKLRYFTELVASRNRYNPVEELLEGLVWDGRSRKAELERAMGISPGDGLSAVLLEKWLLQSVALALNDEVRPYGADGVLVLNGPQGIGKTSLVRLLGMRPDLYRCGLSLDPRNRDELKRCTSVWLAELGEVESTLRKADQELLKAFITRERDDYREPYADADCSRVRRTSFIATCNSEEFLADDSGSRRFWVIPVEDMDLGALRRIDFRQLWAEVYAEYTAPGTDRERCFRLTRGERERLEERNGRHDRKNGPYVEVGDILAFAATSDEYYMKPMTVTAFKEQHNCLTRFDAVSIGKSLRKHGVERIEPRGIHGWTYMLPCRRHCPDSL